MTGRVRARFPAAVYRHGTDPDPRFSLANERTFLAWIRTALALIAGGVAVDAVRVPLPEAIRIAVVVVLLLLGLLVPVLAWCGWASTEKALRLDLPLPASMLALPLALGVLLVAGLVAVGVLLA